MAMGARTTIAEVSEVVALGVLDPEAIITPGIFVQRIVKVADATGQQPSQE
jgi:3-oxoadipate CoA-transferase alpha subunit